MVPSVRTFGTVAGTLNSAGHSRYGTARTNAGRRGERSTARWLTDTFRDDHIWCYHDLWVPGGRGRNGETANIDHVLVTGNRVLVIDSKQWQPAFYWTVAGRTFRGLRRFEYGDKAGVALAVDRLAERLPHATVSGLTLVWPSSRTGSLNLWLHRAGETRSYVGGTRRAARAIRAALGEPAAPHPTIPTFLATLLPKPARR